MQENEIGCFFLKVNIKFFKPTSVLLSITSSFRVIHSFTTLLLKEYSAMSSLTVFIYVGLPLVHD